MAPRSRSNPASAASLEPVSQKERLQKVLAAAGISSRRDCEELIRDGRVEVDRQVITEMGARVDPARHEIRVDGVVLPRPKLVYYVLNKPTGVVSTNRDPDGRPRVIDLLPSDQRLFPVGRLDRNSDGLMLVTNDGELANQLTHPKYGVEKTYAARVAGDMSPETLQSLRQGVRLAEGLAKVTSVRVKRRHKQSTDLEIVLREGRNREIRRILARVGHKVVKLTRIAMGTLRLGDLPSGAYRPLTQHELRGLRQCVQPERAEERGSGGAGGRGSRRKLKQLKASAEASPAAKPKSSTRKSSTRKPSTRKPSTQVPRKGAVLDYDDPPNQPDTKDQERRSGKRQSGRKTRRGSQKES
ncbi:MAG: rRNA pseudouridine synthase [Planctomycetaceae bacterium]|nr:MAG: rRNA pseudouridine synthase [Planctomycetaceae bacterium]